MGVSDFEPHYEGSPIAWASGTPSAVGSHEFTARPGHHLPPREDVFESLGTGFTLVSVGGMVESVDSFPTSADSLGVPFEVVVRDRCGEVDGYGFRLVLVRPDHFVS